MWLCESCFTTTQHRALTTRARVLSCCGCKGRKPCFLVVRRSHER